MSYSLLQAHAQMSYVAHEPLVTMYNKNPFMLVTAFYLINPCCFLQVDCPDLYRGRHKDDANPSLKYAQEVHSAIKKAKEKGRSVSPTALSFAQEFN